MANSKTDLDPISVGYERGDIRTITPIIVAYDTAADFTLYSAVAGKHIGVLGMQYVEGDAHNLSFKSGSTTLITYQMAANSGISAKLGGGVMFATNKGEALVMNCDVPVATFIVYVTEFTNLHIN